MYTSTYAGGIPDLGGFLSLGVHPDASNYVGLFLNNGLGNYGYHSPEVLQALFPNYYKLISELYRKSIYKALFFGGNVLITEFFSLLLSDCPYEFKDIVCLDIQSTLLLIERRNSHLGAVFGPDRTKQLLQHPIEDLEFNLSSPYASLRQFLSNHGRNISQFDYISMHGVSDYLKAKHVTTILNVIASQDRPQYISIRQVKVSNSFLSKYRDEYIMLNQLLPFVLGYDLPSYIQELLHHTNASVDEFVNDSLSEPDMQSVCEAWHFFLEGAHSLHKAYYYRQLDCLIRRLPRLRNAWIEFLIKQLNAMKMGSENTSRHLSMLKGGYGLYFETINGWSDEDLV